jgi:prepilin signal peptidase PulO-like enzyme (type II secretory pathway)
MIVFYIVFKLGAFSSTGCTNWLTAAFFGGIFAIFAAFGKCGGGDAIMAATIGLCSGFEQTLWTVTIASIGMILWHFVRIVSSKLQRRKGAISAKMMYPYAPFVLFGYCVTQAVKYLF